LLPAVLAEVLPISRLAETESLRELRIEPSCLQILEWKVLLQVVIGHHLEPSVFDRLRLPARDHKALVASCFVMQRVTGSGIEAAPADCNPPSRYGVLSFLTLRAFRANA
jgi:hypothetical protein